MDDGQTLYTVGMDGACMGWDACAGTKVDEQTMAPSMFAAVAVDRKRRMMACATTSGELFDVRRVGGSESGSSGSGGGGGSGSGGGGGGGGRRGSSGDDDLMQGTIHATISSGSLPIVVRNNLYGAVTITRMIVTKGNNALLCGMSDGAIRVYPWPLIPGKDVEEHLKDDGGTMEERAHRFTELRIHASAVTGMEVTHDDTFLFSTSEDGCVFVHELVQVVNGVEMKSAGGVGGGGPTVDEAHFNVDAILVSKEDMDEQMLAIQSLTKEMQELKSDTEYALHVKVCLVLVFFYFLCFESRM